METKNLFYLLFSLGISSATILTDHFFTPIPDWLAIVFIILSSASLLIFIIKSRNNREKA